MAISEACKWEIKEEVDQMVDRGDAATKSEAFDAMVEFYRTIGIEIKKKTIETKYYRASARPSNEGNTETPTATSDSEEIKEIKRQPAKDGTMRGGPRPGAGRKMNPQPQHDQPARKEDLEKTQNQCTEAYQFETIAISQLRRIRKDDPDRVGALIRVKKWIESQLSKG
jgi:hypothetical protein